MTIPDAEIAATTPEKARKAADWLLGQRTEHWDQYYLGWRWSQLSDLYDRLMKRAKELS